jgi:prolyl-tRNA editing enzyme YbaK/EbsC (Cys-tRNA(Pro) deacylase)
MSWPDPVERVAVFLRAAGAEARLEEFESATPSAQAAADAIGCALEQIVKSLVFVCGSEPVLALLPGDRRADPAKIALAAEARDARVANPSEVLDVTGFAPGGVSPVPPPPDTLVLVERTIISAPVVWVGGGSDRHMVMLAPPELVRLTGGALADIAQE